MTKATKKVTKKTAVQKKTTQSVGRPKAVKTAVKAVKKTIKVVAKVAAKPAKKKLVKAAPVKKTIAKKAAAPKKAPAKKVAIKKTTRAKKPVSFIAEIQALIVKAKKELDQRTAALHKQAAKIDSKIVKAKKVHSATEAALSAPATAKKTSKLQAALKETTALVDQLAAEALNIAAAQQSADSERAVLNGLQFAAPAAAKKAVSAPAVVSTRGRPKKNIGSEKTSAENTSETATAQKEALEAVVA
jgi:hypothetical protein